MVSVGKPTSAPVNNPAPAPWTVPLVVGTPSGGSGSGSSGLLTSAQLLDLFVPSPSTSAGEAGSSKTGIQHTIKISSAWTPKLSNLRADNTPAQFYPVNIDPTLAPISDSSQVAWAAKHYIVAPVNMILESQARSRNVQINCQSIVDTENKSKRSLSMFWTFQAAGTASTPFAAIQFDGYQSVVESQWTSTQLLTISPGRGMCARLLWKANSYNIRYLVEFDWNTMVLLVLGNTDDRTQSRDASARYTKNIQTMKWYLFEFLTEALREKMAGK